MVSGRDFMMNFGMIGEVLGWLWQFWLKLNVSYDCCVGGISCVLQDWVVKVIRGYDYVIR